MSTQTINPLFLHSDSTPNPYIFILLNQPITHPTLFRHLWDNASLHIIADGAANHLHALSKTLSHPFTPTIILGDLDSLTPSTRSHFESLKVPILHFPDQDATDFTKCLTWGFSNLPASLEGREKEGGKIDVVAFNGLGGRLDASFHSLHQLFLWEKGGFPCKPEDAKERRGRLWLVSPPNLAFLLPGGKSLIQLGGKVEKERVFGRGICGILPVAGERMVRTKGLRWDTEWVQGVGVVEGFGLSTSNEVVGGEVEVEVDGGGGVVFTIEMGGCWDKE